MNVYDKMHLLSSGEMQAAWTASVNKGDSFYINGVQYHVIVNTNKTLRLKNNSDVNYTFKRYGNLFMVAGKEANIFRNAEGEIIRDLLNRYNVFHETSDVFKMTVKLFNNK